MRIFQVSSDATQSDIIKSFRRLIKRYHPYKNNDSDEACDELIRVYAAYHLLASDEPIDIFTEKQITALSQNLFQSAFLRVSADFLTDEDSEGNDSDTDVTNYDQLVRIEQQAQENAQKLVDEEEQEKKKLEKKRERRKKHKQRRKEKKREEKEGIRKENKDQYEIKEMSVNSPTSQILSPKKKKALKIDENDSDNPEIDLGSAFCSKVKQKVQKSEALRCRKLSDKSPTTDAKKLITEAKVTDPQQQQQQQCQTENGVSDQSEVISEENFFKSQDHARKGNEYAQFGKLHNAVEEYAKAITLNKNDHRCFGNRSYCYHSLKKFSEALSDANSAINLVPNEPKGYFRKAKALCGLKRFNEAENALNKILELDPDCSEASHELFEVRLMQLQDFGFDRRACEHALIKSKNDIQGAIECLLSSQFQDNMSFTTSESNSEYNEVNTSPPQPITPSQPFIYNNINHATPISNFYPVINPVYNSNPIRILSVAPGTRPTMMTPFHGLTYSGHPTSIPNMTVASHMMPSPQHSPQHKPIPNPKLSVPTKLKPDASSIQPNTMAVRPHKLINNKYNASNNNINNVTNNSINKVSKSNDVIKSISNGGARKFDPRDYSLWIGHFDSKKITEKDLFDVFTKYGKVSGVVIIKTHGKPLAYSFIHFMKHEDAKRAFNAAQNHVIQGISLDVNWNKNPTIECEHWLRGHCPYSNCHYLHVGDHQCSTTSR